MKAQFLNLILDFFQGFASEVTDANELVFRLVDDILYRVDAGRLRQLLERTVRSRSSMDIWSTDDFVPSSSGLPLSSLPWILEHWWS